MSADLLTEVRGRVGLVTLDRPAALNALSHDMVLALDKLLHEWAGDPGVHAVLVRGAGDKAFCAGGDIRELYQSAISNGELHREFFIAEYRLDYYTHCYPKPYVALMDGITMGGGMGIAQGAQLRIVGERTRIAMPEVGIGLFPDVGGSFFLSRLPGALGTYLALTGSQIRAADALCARLADCYLPPEAVARLEDTLTALRWTGNWGTDVTSAVLALASKDLPAPPLEGLRPAIERHFAQGSVADILHSLATEQQPEFLQWARETIALMNARSPLMMAVALRQLQLGRTKSLADCFRMELGMMRQCFEHGDAIEGVRAFIAEKDDAPHWNPPHIEDVTPEMVNAFFENRWLEFAHPLAGLEKD